MLVSMEISLHDLLVEMLANHSEHCIMYNLAHIKQHSNPDDFADKFTKLLNDGCFNKAEGF